MNTTTYPNGYQQSTSVLMTSQDRLRSICRVQAYDPARNDVTATLKSKTDYIDETGLVEVYQEIAKLPKP